MRRWMLVVLGGCGGAMAAPAAAPVAPVAVAVAAPTSAACPPPHDGEQPPHADDAPLVAQCHDVYVDATMPPAQRDEIARDYAASVAAIAAMFGAADREPPALVSCLTDACELRFTGPTRRSHADVRTHGTVFVNGFGKLTPGTITHEMVHVEIGRRLGARQAALPTWFDEGVATYVGDNVQCPVGLPRGIDDLRRLDTGRAWAGYTNLPGKMNATYCQVHAEIAAWTEKHGRAALVGVIDAVAAGQEFDQVYGPLVTAVPMAERAHGVVADVRFDDNTGTDAIDSTGTHISSLMAGATWTAGHRGAGVQVADGSFVRADRFTELGVPDAPFTLSLWVKPLANGKVIVHTAKEAAGTGGWCAPLLGTDATGRVIAQVPYDAKPDAYLVATGPVLPLHAWSHVALAWSADDGARLFVGGALVASAAPRGAAERHRFAPAAPMYLFVGSSNHSRCWAGALEPGDWNGAIDELRVYDYAISEAEAAGRG